MAETDLTQEEQNLARRLLEARMAANISQEKVAEHLGIPRASVSAIETAKRKVSSLELKRLARLYRRSITDFLDEDTDEIDDAARESAALFRAIGNLSPEEQQHVRETIRLLQRRRQRDRTANHTMNDERP